MSKLRDQDREILRVRYESAKPLREHAVKVGRTEGALKRALVRIREGLRKCIETEVASYEPTI